MMFFRRHVICVCVLITVFGLISCEEKKEGKVIVTEKGFVIRKDSDHSFTVDARGKVKNVGDIDVKRVVVTAHCRSCGDLLMGGKWFVSDIAKTEDQIDTISYLSAGDEEEFSFREVAFYYGPVGLAEPELPEKLEVVIESFETVDR